MKYEESEGVKEFSNGANGKSWLKMIWILIQPTNLAATSGAKAQQRDKTNHPIGADIKGRAIEEPTNYLLVASQPPNCLI